MIKYVPGNEADFVSLYEESYSKILGKIIRMFPSHAEAEDVVQTAFMQAYKGWAAWIPDAPAEAWVLRIAVNGALSQIRKNKIRTPNEIVRRLGAPLLGDPNDIVMTNEFYHMVTSLPPKEAQSVILRFSHGYTNRDIGKKLGIPERTIASRLSAARSRLKEKLKDERNGRTS